MENENIPNTVQETPETQAPEKPAMPEEPALPPKPARSKKWWIIGGLLVIFLGAAGFFGARMLKSQGKTFGMGGAGPSMGIMTNKGGSQKSIKLDMTPAKELPQDQPTTNGIFVRREDQSIFIGTGRISMMVKKQAGSSSNAPADVSSKYDGPVVEVVINHQTKVYQDITEMMPPESASSGEVKVQQVVKPGSLDDLGANMMVTVWGDKQGDRFIAKVVVFR